MRTRDQLRTTPTQRTRRCCTLTLALRRLQLIGRSFGDPPEGLASCQCRGAARATTPVAPNTACGSDDTTVGGPTCGRATARSAPALGVVVQLGPLAVHEREPIVPCLREQACRTCGWRTVVGGSNRLRRCPTGRPGRAQLERQSRGRPAVGAGRGRPHQLRARLWRLQLAHGRDPAARAPEREAAEIGRLRAPAHGGSQPLL